MFYWQTRNSTSRFRYIDICITLTFFFSFISLLFSSQLLLSLAGLQVVLEAKQTDFPAELFPVMMWAIAKAPLKITA